jgi:hypothetical protein
LNVYKLVKRPAINLTESITMNDKEYNGWTNYATWRIALEIFDSLHVFGDDPKEVTADDCEDYAKMIVDNGSSEGLALDYAFAFLSDVNWQEVADHLNEQ